MLEDPIDLGGRNLIVADPAAVANADHVEPERTHDPFGLIDPSHSPA